MKSSTIPTDDPTKGTLIPHLQQLYGYFTSKHANLLPQWRQQRDSWMQRQLTVLDDRQVSSAESAAAPATEENAPLISSSSSSSSTLSHSYLSGLEVKSVMGVIDYHSLGPDHTTQDITLPFNSYHISGVVAELVEFARRQCGYLPNTSMENIVKLNLYGATIKFFALLEVSQVSRQNLDEILSNGIRTDLSECQLLDEIAHDPPGSFVLFITSRPEKFVNLIRAVIEKGFKPLITYRSSVSQFDRLDELRTVLEENLIAALDLDLVLDYLTEKRLLLNHSFSAEKFISLVKSDKIPDWLQTKSDIALKKDMSTGLRPLLTYWQNMCAIIRKVTKPNALIYIDWENINVPLGYISLFVQSLIDFAAENGAAKTRHVRAFLDRRYNSEVVTLLQSCNVEIIHIEASARKILTQILVDTINGQDRVRPSDTILFVSGNRNFSALLAAYHHLGYDILHIYNMRTYPTFKNNSQWLNKLDYLDLPLLANLKLEFLEKKQLVPQLPRQSSGMRDEATGAAAASTATTASSAARYSSSAVTTIHQKTIELLCFLMPFSGLKALSSVVETFLADSARKETCASVMQSLAADSDTFIPYLNKILQGVLGEIKIEQWNKWNNLINTLIQALNDTSSSQSASITLVTLKVHQINNLIRAINLWKEKADFILSDLIKSRNQTQQSSFTNSAQINLPGTSLFSAFTQVHELRRSSDQGVELMEKNQMGFRK